jgi:hypothetical protein
MTADISFSAIMLTNARFDAKKKKNGNAKIDEVITYSYRAREGCLPKPRLLKLSVQ